MALIESYSIFHLKPANLSIELNNTVIKSGINCASDVQMLFVFDATENVELGKLVVRNPLQCQLRKLRCDGNYRPCDDDLFRGFTDVANVFLQAQKSMPEIFLHSVQMGT